MRCIYLDSVFAPVDAVPRSLVYEIHHDTNTVWDEDKDSCLLCAFGDSVRNDTIDNNTDDTVGDGLDSWSASFFSVHEYSIRGTTWKTKKEPVEGSFSTSYIFFGT